MRCAIRTAFTVMVFAGLPAIQAQTPLSIEDAVSQALLNRPELRTASERLIASKHLQTQAKLLPNPRFYFQTEDLRASNFDFAKDSETYAYASELIETSGRRRARTSVAAQEVQRNRFNADRLTAQVATRVRHAYWSAQSAQLLLRLYTEDAGYYRQIIAYHEARFREGKLVRVLPSEPRFRPSSSSFSCSTPFAGFVILDEQPLRLQEVPCWYLRKPYEESMG